MIILPSFQCKEDQADEEQYEAEANDECHYTKIFITFMLYTYWVSSVKYLYFEITFVGLAFSSI